MLCLLKATVILFPRNEPKDLQSRYLLRTYIQQNMNKQGEQTIVTTPSTSVSGSVETIPYSHLVFNPNKHSGTLIRHLNSVYQSMLLLANLTPKFHEALEKKVQRMQCRLPKITRKKKTLFLDLDETLVHTSLRNEGGRFSQKIEFRDATVYFNVRPRTFDFIRALSKLYQIIIFTSSTLSYAIEFFSYLNSHTGGCLSTVLTREHCIEFSPGLYLKDLRIISNRNVKNMVLVDNTPYAFGANIENGVPVHSFTNDQSDCELEYLQGYLEEMAKVEDVREFNRQRLGLRRMVQGTIGVGREQVKEEYVKVEHMQVEEDMGNNREAVLQQRI